MIIFSFSTSTTAQDCGQHEWAKEDSRTQGGGWVWFPGKASNANLSLATMHAEGAALEYLKGECQRIPQDTKFNEKCVERTNGKFVVYVRAAIRDRACSSGNDVNRELTRRHLNYTASLSNQRLNVSVCNQRNALGCYQLADREWRVKNMAAAIGYAEAACTYGDMYSCGFLGFMHYQMQNPYEAKQYLEIGCKQDQSKVWCDSLSDLVKQIQNS